MRFKLPWCSPFLWFAVALGCAETSSDPLSTTTTPTRPLEDTNTNMSDAADAGAAADSCAPLLECCASFERIAELCEEAIARLTPDECSAVADQIEALPICSEMPPGGGDGGRGERRDGGGLGGRRDGGTDGGASPDGGAPEMPAPGPSCALVLECCDQAPPPLDRICRTAASFADEEHCESVVALAQNAGLCTESSGM